MRQWIPHIYDSRKAIWEMLNTGYGVGVTTDPTDRSQNLRRHIHIDIPFETFRVFGFLDNTGFRTTAPGQQSRRDYGLFNDVQRSFYSAYFAGHGMKVQALTLPNGMFGSIYVGSWRVSDSGLLNMSGLDSYLSNLFNE